jgi:excisionase family DNA binding protein
MPMKTEGTSEKTPTDELNFAESDLEATSQSAGRLAISACELAERLGISERHVWALHSSGRLPRPIRFGRAVRWPVQEIEEWLAAGAPGRSHWEEMLRKC